MSENQPETCNPKPIIGTLNEAPLHAALKAWYAQPGDRLEAPVGGFVVDILRGDLLIEIQTGNFSSLKHKLRTLTEEHPVRLVYPVARNKWLVKLPPDGEGDPRRRKSPKHGDYAHVFDELVSLPRLLESDNFAIEVLLTHEEEIRRYVGDRAWRRRGWATEERRLLEVVERRLFGGPADLSRLLPDELSEPFTTADLADALGERRRLAQKMAYCLRKMQVLTPLDKRGNAILYVKTSSVR